MASRLSGVGEFAKIKSSILTKYIFLSDPSGDWQYNVAKTIPRNINYRRWNSRWIKFQNKSKIHLVARL